MSDQGSPESILNKFLSCIYDMSVNGQEFELSLGHKIVTSPVDTIYFDGKTAEGKFRATMELFKNDGFKKKDSYKVIFCQNTEIIKINRVTPLHCRLNSDCTLKYPWKPPIQKFIFK